MKKLTDIDILAGWRRATRELSEAQVQYSQAYLKAKIRKESDGTAHQIATEETGGLVTVKQGEVDIYKALWYGRKVPDDQPPSA